MDDWQARADAQYKEAFGRWVEELSPEDRVKAMAAGVCAADAGRKGGGSGLAFDEGFADSIGVCDPVSDGGAELMTLDALVTERALQIVRMALSNIIYPSRGRTIACEAEIVGLCIDMPGLVGASKVAGRHGVTRQAISKACRKFCRESQLPPSRYMTSEASCNVHRLANRRRAKA